MNVNVRQLEAFVSVARLGGFSRAAERLHLTQAGLSILVRKLEESLGVRLFERTTRSVALTAAGQEILASAERILADLQSLAAAAREIGVNHAARISLALPPRLAMTHLPVVLKRFRERHPHVAIAFRECINEELASRVQNRDVDFGLAFGIEPNGELACEPLGDDALVAVCAVTHPLARKRTLRWRDLIGHDIITLPTTSAARTLIEQRFAVVGHALTPVYEANSLVAIALARQGLGIAVVSSAMTGPAAEGDEVRRVLREPTIIRPLLAVTRRLSRLSQPAQDLIDLFRQPARARRSKRASG